MQNNRYNPPEGTTVSMIFTHQARMRCFVRKTIDPIVGSMQKDSVVGVFNDDDDEDDDDDRDSEDSRFSSESHFGTPVNLDDSDYDDDNITTRDAIFSRPDYLDDYKEVPIHEQVDNRQAVVAGGGKGFKLPRFKNGSVLEYTVTAESINIRLLIDGEVDEQKAKYIYYVIPGDEFRDEGAMQGRYRVTPFNPLTIPNTKYTVSPGQKYIFYIVRHGQATHNLLKSKAEKLANVMAGMKDTSLTVAGKEQAQRSGKKMAELIKKGTALPPGHIFSSDLKRTRETSTNFITGLLKNIDEATPEHKYIANVVDKHRVVVLPCAHELAFVKSGDCDGSQGILPTPPENQMTCTSGNQACNYEGHFDINWDEYYKFYANSTRSKLCKSCGARHCRNTDMVSEAIRIINEEVGTNTTRPIRFAQGTKRTDGIKTRQGTWVSSSYGGKKGKKTMRNHKNKKHKTRKSHTNKRLTRHKRKSSTKRVKKTRKSKK